MAIYIAQASVQKWPLAALLNPTGNLQKCSQVPPVHLQQSYEVPLVSYDKVVMSHNLSMGLVVKFLIHRGDLSYKS